MKFFLLLIKRFLFFWVWEPILLIALLVVWPFAFVLGTIAGIKIDYDKKKALSK